MRFLPYKSSDEKLDAVIAHLCHRLGDLWTMQAVKLPYLVDLVSVHVLSRTVTRSQHKAWDYGVVTARAWGMMKRDHGGRYFAIDGDPFADGAKIRVKEEPPAVLDSDEQAIVDFVADSFGEISPVALGKFTKSLNPTVKHWGGKDPVDLDDDAYKLLPVWFGEDEKDAKDAAKVLASLKDSDLISGEEADCLLAEWAR